MTRRQTHGTLLQLSDGAASNPTFTTIAHVRSVKPPSIERGITELADHDMSATKMYLPNGLGGLGAVDFDIYLDPQDAGHETLLELASGVTVEDWKIVLPGGAGTWEFSGFITKYDPQPVDADDGVLEATLSLQPSDTPVLS